MTANYDIMAGKVVEGVETSHYGGDPNDRLVAVTLYFTDGSNCTFSAGSVPNTLLVFPRPAPVEPERPAEAPKPFMWLARWLKAKLEEYGA